MNIQAATLAGGSNNQDRYIVGDGFAAVLDGATSVAGDRSHDPGWYAEQLARFIGEAVPRAKSLADAVAEAICAVRDTYGLTPATTPTSTVALARWSNDTVETFVLGDSYLVALHTDGTSTVRTDDRLDNVAIAERTAYRKRLAAGAGYDDAHRALLLQLQTEQAKHVNRPGGYWIAGAEPEAAYHGFTTTESLSGISAVLIASDGVEPERYPEGRTWSDIYREASRRGAMSVLRGIHDAETSDIGGQLWPRSKAHDDKCLVVVPLQE